jgi:RHS repeat-associated protein
MPRVMYENTPQEKWKFTSFERDVESSLDYAQARFNSPLMGRFMSVDPLAGRRANPQSLNRYTYVLNDPINLVDPTGAEPDDPGGSDGPPDEPTVLIDLSTDNNPFFQLGLSTCDPGDFTCEATNLMQAGLLTGDDGLYSLGLMDLDNAMAAAEGSLDGSNLRTPDSTGLFYSIVGPPFVNQLPDLLPQELEALSNLGITPISPGDPNFAAIAEQAAGKINWTLSTDGQLLTTPALDGVTHAATAGGSDVLGAGTAQVATGGGETIVFDVTAQSGHYLNGATAAQSESAIEAGISAFGSFVDGLMQDLIFFPMVNPKLLSHSPVVDCPGGDCSI